MSEYVIPVLMIVAGLVVLVGGGEFLVRGASALAAAMRVPPLIVGLTVVAFGTSAPELGVSLQATFSGSAEVAVGNVIGSNIFNVLFVLGLSALVAPLIVSSQLVRYDVPLMIGATLLTYLLARDGTLGKIDGAVLVVVLLGYLGLCFRNAKKEPAMVQAEFANEYDGEPTGEAATWTYLGIQVLWMVGGLVGLGLGAKWLVGGAVTLASAWGVSELVIGLTIIATGTSLPEVVTSVVASLRGERDIAVGNVVGSNIFNLGCVLGISSLVAPDGMPFSASAIAFDMPVMIAVAMICLPIFFTGGIIARWEGALFFGYYLAYTGLLVLLEINAELASSLTWFLTRWIIPGTGLALLGSFLTSVWQARRSRPALLRQQVAVHVDARGPDQDNENAGEDEQDQREN